MRSQIIIHERAEKLHYEIREIVNVARQIELRGQKITWENIGDPVKKGEKVSPWIKRVVAKEAMNDASYAYSPTKGVEAARIFLADQLNRRKKVRITMEDIVFFNGLGDAVGKIYGVLDPRVRIIGPTPSYSTHSSAEAAHAGTSHLTYRLDPQNKWLPDLRDLEDKIKKNRDISGILFINPNNPTGTVYPREYIEKIVSIAKKFDLFLVADEIYCRLSYATKPFVPLSDVIGDVCGVSMKGISKEIPWPGSRCGWLEFYNTEKDPVFAKYVKAITDSKMLEVSSTTLPQRVIPKILGDARYRKDLAVRNKTYKQRANRAVQILSKIEGITAIKPEGAFYMSVVFEKNVLRPSQKLSIKNPEVDAYVRKLLEKKFALDKRFAYYLLGATGICVVPLTGFETQEFGFRITLLEPNPKRFDWIFQTIAQKIEEYLNSA